MKHSVSRDRVGRAELSSGVGKIVDVQEVLMLSAVCLMVLTMASNALSARPIYFILADDCSYRDLELYGENPQYQAFG